MDAHARMEEAGLWVYWVVPVDILYVMEVAEMNIGFGAVFWAAGGLDLLVIVCFQVMGFGCGML